MLRLWGATALLTFLLSASVMAQLSPGKLSRFHESLEGLSNCTRCHELGQEVTNSKCLECHGAIQAHKAEGKGYHNSPEVKDAKCASCHSEHAGRDFELVNWKGGKQSFDHRTTGFVLDGGHHGVECSSCHKSAFVDESLLHAANVNVSRTYLGLSTDCGRCHADEHEGQLAAKCASCHDATAWKPASKFSHVSTKYPLTGKHATVDCEKCHEWQTATAIASDRVQKKERVGTYQKFTGLVFSNCAPCHNDVHNGKFGANCSACHTTAAFKQIVGNSFDHSKTKYPLEGRHKTVQCLSCHTSGDMTKDLAFAACRDCHKDEHRGQFAARTDKGVCESCHTTDGYSPSKYDVTDHSQSRYPLTGSHLAVPCTECHAKSADLGYARYKFDDLACKSCHKDPHAGQLDIWINKGGCEFCHSTDTWHRTSFDHKLARFPLEGKHREILCLKCHKVQNQGTPAELVWIKPLSMECSACHDDVHRGQFVRADLGQAKADCKACHSAEAWKKLTFNHDKDTHFALSGAHAKVACVACHKPTQTATETYVVYKGVPTECTACHGKKG